MRRVGVYSVLVFLLHLLLIADAFGVTPAKQFIPKQFDCLKPKTPQEILSAKENVSKRSSYSTVWRTKVRQDGKVRESRNTNWLQALITIGEKIETHQNVYFVKFYLI